MDGPCKDSNATGFALRREAAVANTFGVAVRARLVAELRVTEALPELLTLSETAEAGATLVLGGGSNVLFTRDFPGTVLRIATRGIEPVEQAAEYSRVRIAAGEPWDGFVRWSLARGLAGLENLILIPGATGAAPIQNIGAYGVELSEFVFAVEAWDCSADRFVRLPAAACGFGYRDSVFKREPGRHIVTGVVLDLPRRRELRLDYGGVEDELRAMGIVVPSHTDVARAVERLRRRKLPDPAVTGNAGSFFKNPLVPLRQAHELELLHPQMPLYPAPAGQAKLSAGWLIEACGFKGCREGDAGVSEKHALVLVNYGRASGGEILALAERIRCEVFARFGVTLEPEPLIR